jgi:hypothetical protein
MKFLHLFHKEVEFGNIEGYDDVKYHVRRALDSEENYNLLLCGPPASGKTLFLQEIEYAGKKRGVFFDRSNTTSRILDVLEEKRPKIILLDELDKMSRQFQNQLLNFLESGRIKVISPVHNQKDFYLGVYQGGGRADKVFGTGHMGSSADECPGHTAEYCAGWNFGLSWDYDELGDWSRRDWRLFTVGR